MIEEFFIKNFLSFRNEVTFSMLAANSVKENEEDAENKVNSVHVIPETNNVRILKTAAIYGANGSGKSNVINALMFFYQMVMESFSNDNILKGFARNKYLFDNFSENEPSEFQLAFWIEGARYRYGFSVGKEEIVAEWLFVQTKGSARESYCFKREGENITVNTRTFQKSSGVVERTRNNALFLSTASQFNVPLAMMLKYWLRDNIAFVNGIGEGTRMFSARQFIRDNYMHDNIVTMLGKVDNGVKGLDVQEFEEEQYNPTVNTDPQMTFSQVDNVDKKEQIHRFDISAVHDVYDEGMITGNKVLPFRYESMGTNKMFSLSGPWFDTLRKGGTLIIDEFGTSLHTLLSMELVKMFESKLNTKGAQLIITTHDTNLLRKDIFRRDQIWFTEKDKFGASDLYSLVEYKINQATSVRNDATFSKDYLIGKYGAIPFFGGDDFVKSFINEE